MADLPLVDHPEVRQVLTRDRQTEPEKRVAEFVKLCARHFDAQDNPTDSNTGAIPPQKLSSEVIKALNTAHNLYHYSDVFKDDKPPAEQF